MEPTLLEKATRMATIAHQGQVRKEGSIPYITHPIMIALSLVKHGFPDAVIAAALVHDVPEDTTVTAKQLRAELGDEVADIVATVTEDKSLVWKERKVAYIEMVRAGSDAAKAVSTADKIHNAQSLLLAHASSGPVIWEHFNQGREQKLWFEHAMLAMLRETWQHPLVDEYAALVDQMDALA